jgi:hypothetical protein
MTAQDKSQSPNCDQILENKKEWGLNQSDLSFDSIVEFLSENSLETESLENSFIKRFLKLKFNNLRYLLSLLSIDK